MRKRRAEKIRIAAILLTGALAAAAFSGCGGGETAQENYIEISCGTGENEAGKPYSDLYYRNDPVASGADPGVMWVSEEDDEENGGYYYAYTTAVQQIGNTVYSAFCYRSKDLSSWEVAGSENGYALVSAADDWTAANFWAPECIYDSESGKYYLYYSAQRSEVARGDTAPATNYSELQLAVAVSDRPQGPFSLVRGGTDANGEEITNTPRFDIAKHFNLSKPFAAIDASVFKDDDGSLYLTFAKHEDSSGRNRGIWGMKLLDPVTPDYSTLTCLTMAGYKSVQNFQAGVLTDDTFPVGGEAFTADSVLNEGNFLWKKNGKYYLTYSTHGYADKSYCVMQAVADRPLGGYVKFDSGKGNPLVSAMASGLSYMAGTGHHSMAAAGNELFSVYAYHGNPEKYGDANMRILGADRVEVTEIDGKQALVCNGPTASPQYKAESVSGYENLARKAKITVNNGAGAEYLNDGLLTVSASVKDREYRSSGAAEITLTFDAPVKARSLMIYNSSSYDYAFTKADRVEFTFASPVSANGKEYLKGAIKDLLFPQKYVDESAGSITQGAAAIADFEEIEITEIKIYLSSKYETTDQFGEVLNDIGVSEIVVLGKSGK